MEFNFRGFDFNFIIKPENFMMIYAITFVECSKYERSEIEKMIFRS